MRKLFIAFIIGWLGCACSEEKVGVYSLENDYIYFEYDGTKLGSALNPIDSVYLYYNSSSVSVNSSQQRDTFFFRVLVAGVAKEYDRKIKLEPYTYEMANVGVGVKGVNYVSFDDPEMEKYLVVPADSLGTDIPIIVTYDPAIAGTYKNFTVGFRLADSDDFNVMATNPNLQPSPARTYAYVRFTQSN